MPRTLDALRAHVLAAGESPGPLEVIVVDNGSTDDTARLALAASSPAMPVRVVPCARPGKGAAVREGMRHTTADVVGVHGRRRGHRTWRRWSTRSACSTPVPTWRSAPGRCPVR